MKSLKKPRKYLRKISPAKSLYRKKWRECEEAWKQACLRRDKGKCALHKEGSEAVVQVDHFISRSRKATFFDPRNGTTVCRSDNLLKAFKSMGMDVRIAMFVREREGEEAVAEMLEAAQHSKKWTIGELEAQITYLNGLERKRGQA